VGELPPSFVGSRELAIRAARGIGMLAAAGHLHRAGKVVANT
jgi:hypothetical protein